MRMDGTSAARAFEDDELPYLKALFPGRLCPIGQSGGMIYLVAEDGRWVSLHEGWTVIYVMKSMDDMFTFSLLNENPGASIRELNNDEIPSGY